VFLDNGTVSFVTAYHKGFSASQKAKIITGTRWGW
jgi:hypothetical protein